MKLLICLLLSILFFSLNADPALASSYRINYLSEYYGDNSEQTKVAQTIEIVNLRSDAFVKEFNFFFPKPYLPKNLSISGRDGVETDISEKETGTTVAIFLPDSDTGKDSRQQIRLEYLQSQIIAKKGLIWEINIPSITNNKEDSVTTVVHLPRHATGELSIAKPSPVEVFDQKLTWKNTNNQSIYAIIGSRQHY